MINMLEIRIDILLPVGGIDLLPNLLAAAMIRLAVVDIAMAWPRLRY